MSVNRLMKFLHTMGAIGMMGSMACLVVMMGMALPATAATLGEYVLMRRAMGAIATWVFFPSLGLTLLAGLLAIAFNRGFHNAGWAWFKLATGILVFEGGFVGLLGPLQDGAERAVRAAAGGVDLATLPGTMAAERGTAWVLLGVSVLNVVLGVWRPRFKRRRAQAGRSGGSVAGVGQV